MSYSHYKYKKGFENSYKEKRNTVIFVGKFVILKKKLRQL